MVLYDRHCFVCPPLCSECRPTQFICTLCPPYVHPSSLSLQLNSQNVLLAVQASGSFLTVTASILPISRKRKRDSDSHCNDFGTLTATNAAEAQNLPAGTCTATASAADVETSAPPTGTCDLPANTLTASSPKIGSPQSPAAPPFPLEHYEATIAQMQAANYPLPLSATGQKFLPLGFVASHESGEKHADVAARFRICAYHPDQGTYAKFVQHKLCLILIQFMVIHSHHAGWTQAHA